MIRATVYTDVICSHSWAIAESLARLAQEHGSGISWSYRMFPLVQTTQSFGDKWNNLATTREIGPHWSEVSEHLGVPIAHTLWYDNPVPSTMPVAVAYQAALRQQPGEAPGTPAWRFYDAARTAAMAQKRNVGDRAVLIALAGEAGLDVARFTADLDDPATARAAEAVIQAATAKGVRSRPTVIFTDARGQEYWVIGPQPWDEYRRAAETMLAGASLPGGVLKGGGRIFAFSDMELLADGRIGLPNGEVRSWAARFLTGARRPGPHELTRLHADGVRLVSLQGPGTSLLGVQADSAPAADVALKALQAAVGGEQTTAAPLPTFPAMVALKWVPRTPAAPLAGLAGEYLLHTVARPMPAAELEAYMDRLRADIGRLRQLQADPDLSRRWAPAVADSLRVRTGQLQRMEAAKAAGVWWASPFLLGPSADALLQAARAAYRDEDAVFPLRPFAVSEADQPHVAGHLRTFTQCTERELQGTFRFQTELTPTELAQYMK